MCHSEARYSIYLPNGVHILFVIISEEHVFANSVYMSSVAVSQYTLVLVALGLATWQLGTGIIYTSQQAEK